MTMEELEKLCKEPEDNQTKISIDEIKSDQFNVDEENSLETRLARSTYHKVLRVDTSTEFKCGLVYNRHDIPAKNYIFQKSFSSDFMFDYQKQVEEVEKFFNNFKITSDRTLVVYLTGLQTALCSVVYVCQQKGISLVCMNYNKDTNTWHEQQVLKFDTGSDVFYQKYINIDKSNIHWMRHYYVSNPDAFVVIDIKVNKGAENIGIICNKEEYKRVFFRIISDNDIIEDKEVELSCRNIAFNGETFIEKELGLKYKN